MILASSPRMAGRIQFDVGVLLSRQILHELPRAFGHAELSRLLLLLVEILDTTFADECGPYCRHRNVLIRDDANNIDDSIGTEYRRMAALQSELM